VVLAALVHDVGHLLGLEADFPPGMGGCGTADHEGIGQKFCDDLGFTKSVGYFCKHHVSAKRYKCLREEGYAQLRAFFCVGPGSLCLNDMAFINSFLLTHI
jgi:predicted HD phosphohydrolase